MKLRRNYPMKSLPTGLEIQKIVENSEELMGYLEKPFKVQLFHQSDNVVFKLVGKTEIIAKVGLTGWAKYEFETLQQLSRKNYDVVSPITYVSLQKQLDEDWSFGNLNREVGILFYFPLEGKNLKQEITQVNILNGLNFLKRLHEDKSLNNRIIENYQKVEVERGLRYIKKLFNGEFADQLRVLMRRYQNVEIDHCFIHGGPRLEHFIINDNKIWMIDFEGACIGDRFKDLGIFFTELLSHDIKKDDLIEAYFQRSLRKEEKVRLEFFELRALLVKLYFEQSKHFKNHIEKLIKSS